MEIFLEISAAVGPVLLACMGIAVALIPNIGHRIERWYWVVAFFVIGVLTSYAIWHELHTANVSQVELTNSQTELAKSQTELRSLQTRILEGITGGTNFTYVEADVSAQVGSPPFAPLLMTTKGTGAVFEIRIWVSHLSANSDRNNPAYWEIGLGRYWSYLIPGSILVGNGLRPGEYRVEIDAKNGHVIEDLKIAICNDKFVQSVKAIRGSEVIYEESFPVGCVAQ